MESLPPQRRPGKFVTQQDAVCSGRLSSECAASQAYYTGCSRGRGKLMDTVLAFVKQKHSPVGKKTDRMPFQYITKSTTCQCEREKKNILCQACGHRFLGRVRTRCPLHPTVIHLMDIEACPNCLATHLKEFSAAVAPKRCS